MHLCRKGTPDIMAVLKDGTVLWIEVKTKTGKLKPEQEDFRVLMENVDNHTCMVVQGNVDPLEDYLNKRRG